MTTDLSILSRDFCLATKERWGVDQDKVFDIVTEVHDTGQTEAFENKVRDLCGSGYYEGSSVVLAILDDELVDLDFRRAGQLYQRGHCLYDSTLMERLVKGLVNTVEPVGEGLRAGGMTTVVTAGGLIAFTGLALRFPRAVGIGVITAGTLLGGLYLFHRSTDGARDPALQEEADVQATTQLTTALLAIPLLFAKTPVVVEKMTKVTVAEPKRAVVVPVRAAAMAATDSRAAERGSTPRNGSSAASVARRASSVKTTASARNGSAASAGGALDAKAREGITVPPADSPITVEGDPAATNELLGGRVVSEEVLRRVTVGEGNPEPAATEPFNPSPFFRKAVAPEAVVVEAAAAEGVEGPTVPFRQSDLLRLLNDARRMADGEEIPTAPPAPKAAPATPARPLPGPRLEPKGGATGFGYFYVGENRVPLDVYRQGVLKMVDNFIESVTRALDNSPYKTQITPRARGELLAVIGRERATLETTLYQTPFNDSQALNTFFYKVLFQWADVVLKQTNLSIVVRQAFRKIWGDGVMSGLRELVRPYMSYPNPGAGEALTPTR